MKFKNFKFRNIFFCCFLLLVSMLSFGQNKKSDEIILTKYNMVYEDADTYFPVDIMDNFSETEVILEGSYEGIEFKTAVFKRNI